MDVDPFHYTPRYAPIEFWMTYTGMSRSATQEALDRGDIRSIKISGRRLIDIRRGLEWLGSLPTALPKPPRRRTEAPATAV